MKEGEIVEWHVPPDMAARIHIGELVLCPSGERLQVLALSGQLVTGKVWYLQKDLGLPELDREVAHEVRMKTGELPEVIEEIDKELAGEYR